MAGMSFGGAMDQRLRLANSRDDRGWYDSGTSRFTAHSNDEIGRQNAATNAMGVGSEAAHRDAMSPLLQKSQGLANDMSGMRNTYGRAALPIEIQAKQGMAGLGPGLAQMGFGSRPSAMPQSVSIPDITAPSSPMPQTQPLGLMPLELPSSNSTFEKQQQPYGMRRGRTYVRDKKGRGNPKKDTVNAKLAEGEAVLNAHAAESLGRDTIAALNARGAEAMGLRGSARMKGGKLHAAEGYAPAPGEWDKLQAMKAAGKNVQIDERPYYDQMSNSDLALRTVPEMLMPIGASLGLHSGDAEAGVFGAVKAGVKGASALGTLGKRAVKGVRGLFGKEADDAVTKANDKWAKYEAPTADVVERAPTKGTLSAGDASKGGPLPHPDMGDLRSVLSDRTKAARKLIKDGKNSETGLPRLVGKEKMGPINTFIRKHPYATAGALAGNTALMYALSKDGSEAQTNPANPVGAPLEQFADGDLVDIPGNKAKYDAEQEVLRKAGVEWDTNADTYGRLAAMSNASFFDPQGASNAAGMLGNLITQRGYDKEREKDMDVAMYQAKAAAALRERERDDKYTEANNKLLYDRADQIRKSFGDDYKAGEAAATEYLNQATSAPVQAQLRGAHPANAPQILQKAQRAGGLLRAANVDNGAWIGGTAPRHSIQGMAANVADAKSPSFFDGLRTAATSNGTSVWDLVQAAASPETHGIVKFDGGSSVPLNELASDYGLTLEDIADMRKATRKSRGEQ